METLDIVTFLLVKDNKVLVEKRKSTKDADADKIVFPGGKVEKGETLQNAMLRELKEELGITAKHFDFIGSASRQSKKLLNIHYFVINLWDGEIQKNEAEELVWLDIHDFSSLSFENDKEIIKKHFT